MKRIIPHIVVHNDGLPKWITDSNTKEGVWIAAYHLPTSTIHLNSDRGLKMVKDTFHETIHHLLELLGMRDEVYHDKFDHINLKAYQMLGFRRSNADHKERLTPRQ